jgi:hypothetical protein
MLLIRIARRSRRQVLAGLLAYAVTYGHVSYATPRIDLYQRELASADDASPLSCLSLLPTLPLPSHSSFRPATLFIVLLYY